MSFVGQPFTHDVFVTYSHGDATHEGDSPLQQWSQAFAEELTRELQLLPEVGASLALFLDEGHDRGHSVNRMDPLLDQLRSSLAASAVVAVLLSPHYLASDWCRSERDWWRDGQAALKLPHAGRIALARIWPLAKDAALPDLFLDASGNAPTGFWFFDRKLDPMRCRPYEWPRPSSVSAGPFREALVDLAGHVYEKLRGLRAQIVEQSRTAAEIVKLASAEQVVYLHGRIDQQKQWESANDQLTAGGFTVVPTEPDPVEDEPEQALRARRRRVQTLAECDALLLLGSTDGRAVDSDLLAIGRTERQLARAQANCFLPCALLDTVGAPIATERRRLAARKLQVDWLDPADPWGPSVKAWMLRKSHELADGQ